MRLQRHRAMLQAIYDVLPVGVVVRHLPDVGTGGDLATVTWPRGYLALELLVWLVGVAVRHWPDVGAGVRLTTGLPG